MSSSSNSVPFALESCSMVSASRILVTGKWQKINTGRKSGMVPHQSGLLLMRKEFMKSKNYILSKIFSLKFDYIY